MKPSKEMKERAAASSLKFVEEQSVGEWGEDLVAQDAAKLADVLCAFAAAEVSRAVQECIEAVCGYCAHGSPVEKTACVGRAGDSFYHWEEDEFCQAEKLRELLYQKQLAGEGEEKP